VQTPTPRRTAGVSGLAVVALFATGTALWGFEMPDPGASAAEVHAFYADASGRIVAGASLSLLAIAALVVFASAFRSVLAAADGSVAAATAYGGALLAAAAGLGAETINMAGALRAADGSLGPGLGRALFEVSYVLGFNAAGVGLGVFGLASAAVALRSGAVLPRWLALVTALTGTALLTPLSQVVLAPSVALLALIAAALLREPGPARSSSRSGPSTERCG
jgi:hypothetical protein